jgi:hypothetical protein
MDEVIYSASGPPSSVVSMDEVPSHSASGPLLPLLPGGFKMDQDSYSIFMASSYERHLKRTKNEEDEEAAAA